MFQQLKEELDEMNTRQAFLFGVAILMGIAVLCWLLYYVTVNVASTPPM